MSAPLSDLRAFATFVVVRVGVIDYSRENVVDRSGSSQLPNLG